jgi:hypothetical protein
MGMTPITCVISQYITTVGQIQGRTLSQHPPFVERKLNGTWLVILIIDQPSDSPKDGLSASLVSIHQSPTAPFNLQRKIGAVGSSVS